MSQFNSVFKRCLNFYDHRIGNSHSMGNYLSFSAVPRSGTPDFPAFVDASPNHGPISGGTKFTIVGSSLKQYGGISFVYIGDIKLPIKNWTRYLHDLHSFIRELVKLLLQEKRSQKII